MPVTGFHGHHFNASIIASAIATAFAAKSGYDNEFDGMWGLQTPSRVISACMAFAAKYSRIVKPSCDALISQSSQPTPSGANAGRAKAGSLARIVLSPCRRAQSTRTREFLSRGMPWFGQLAMEHFISWPLELHAVRRQAIGAQDRHAWLFVARITLETATIGAERAVFLFGWDHFAASLSAAQRRMSAIASSLSS